MTEQVIRHEIKLQKSVIVILAVLAIGVCANAFAPTIGIKDALASSMSVFVSGSLGCDFGCN